MLRPLLLYITFFVSSVCVSLHAGQKSCEQPKRVDDPKFKVGQIWSYKTRPGEEKSTVTILRVEELSKTGTIIHVRIDGIHLRNCAGGPSPDTIQHAPFVRASLEQSVVELVGSAKILPEYEDGYRAWLSDCGGVYTIGVDRAVQVDEITFNQGQVCSASGD